MNQTQTPRRFGTAKWALALASIGFAYALATSSSPNVSAQATGVAPRVLTTNCTRLPTEFVTGSDLGAVVIGSSFTRQILVRFGFRPHTFRLGGFTTAAGKLAVSAEGKVTGELTGEGQNQFQVTVADSDVGVPSPSVSRVFNVTAVKEQFSEFPLHFETGGFIAFGTTAQDITLPVALAGDSYYYSLQANGGLPPYKFTILEQPSGRFIPQGLAFDAPDGLIYGKPALPTAPGTPAKINVLLTDSGGAQVTGRFSLDILQGTITSQAVATAGSMSLNFGSSNLADTLQFTLVLDKSELNAVGVLSASDLEGLPIEINFGGFKLPPKAQPKSKIKIVNTFDSRGMISVPAKFLVLGDIVGSNVKDVIYTIKLDPRTGILTAKFTNLNLIKTIGANFRSFEGQDVLNNRGPVIPINIKIGAATETGTGTGTGTDTDTSTSITNAIVDKTDVIKFVYRRSGSIGRGTARMNDNLAPAGIFLINKISGTEKQVVTDKFNNIIEDRLFLKMTGLMRQAGAAPVIPQPNDQVSVFINRLCLGMFPASSFAVMGDKLVFSNADPSKGLKDLIIDNKRGTVTITTNGIDPNTDLFGRTFSSPETR